MRVDLVLPSESATDDPRALVEPAVAAERHGFGAVWLPDHLLPPGGYDNTYGGVHEPLVALAFLATHTDRLLLGTSVLITPLRKPILLAKQTATLDALAPGRVLLGVGTGWERSEFDAVGVEFTGRGPAPTTSSPPSVACIPPVVGQAGRSSRPPPRVPCRSWWAAPRRRR